MFKNSDFSAYVQNNIGNKHSPTITVLPITSNTIKNPLPTHVILPKSCGLEKESLVLAEQIRTISCTRLHDYVGHIDNELQCKVNRALAVCVGLEMKRRTKVEILELNLCSRCESDFRNSGFLVVKKSGWQEKTDCDLCKAVAKGLTFCIFNLDRGE
jgi:mRNA interferase MazF